MGTTSTTFSEFSGNIVAPSAWAAMYGDKHRPVRVTEFPGVVLPQKVRIYGRGSHFLLQWWDPACKKTLSQRVDGDLLESIVRAREIESRLTNYRSSGLVAARLGHGQLVAAFLVDLGKRADAGEVDPRTIERYRTPLQRHFLEFVGQPSVARKYPVVTNIDRDFQLEFSQFLQSRQVSPNGSPSAPRRPMRGQGYVLDVVRSMLHWAADVNRGNLLPVGFQNPFRRSNSTGKSAGRSLSEPDVTTKMAVDFILSCDAFQLPIFATLALYGLRPDELGWMFWEEIHDGWARVVNHPDLSYMTKGRRDKQFPLLSCLQAIWPQPQQAGQGLLFCHRKSTTGTVSNMDKAALVDTFERLCSNEPKHSATRRRDHRKSALRTGGQLTYDHVRAEFAKLSKRLAWPKSATPKDFRHLFATNLENAGVPESYRRFLMGHAPGRAAIVTYTHLNKLREHYLAALEVEFAPLVDAICRRARELQHPLIEI